MQRGVNPSYGPGGYTPGGAGNPWGITPPSFGNFGQVAQEGPGMMAGGQQMTRTGGGTPGMAPFGGPMANNAMGALGLGGGNPVGGAASGMLGMFGGGPSNAMQTIAGNLMPRVATEGAGQMAGVGMRPGGQTITSQSPVRGVPSYDANATLPQPAADPNSALGRIESYFGPLGTPTTPLQQQSLGGISQFLGSNPYGQSNQALQNIIGGGGFNEANQAFRNVGSANYFGGAKNAFQNLGQQNLFGGAQNKANEIGNANYFGNAQDIFGRLENFNPFGSAQASLEGQLGVNPGQGMLDALRPSFERNLAAANQQGGRFGSANAILRSRAVDDYNLLGAQAIQRGVDHQQNATNILGMIGNSLGNFRNQAGQGMLGVGQGNLGAQSTALQGLLGAGQGRLQQGLGVGQGLLGVGQGQLQQGLGAAGGLGDLATRQQALAYQSAMGLGQNQNNMFDALSGAYGIGSNQAQQLAQRQQQAMQMLGGLLGTSFGATFGAPTVVPPTGAQTGAGIGGAIGQALPFMFPGSQSPMIPGQANDWGAASQYRFGY